MADRQGNAEPEELADRANYCEHGVFVGNWATGDYLCGWCEDGVSVEEYEKIQEENARWEKREREAQRLLYAAIYWGAFVMSLRDWLQGKGEEADEDSDEDSDEDWFTRLVRGPGALDGPFRTKGAEGWLSMVGPDGENEIVGEKVKVS